MKVLVADDDALIRDSLKIMLNLEEDIDVVGTAQNGEEAFRLCSELNPDVVLMDIRMPVLDGVLGTKLIKQSFSNIRIIILTTFKDDEYIKEALKNGAEGYILKSQPIDSIADSIRAVYRGNTVFEKDVLNKISNMVKNTESKRSHKDYNLTEREFDILTLIGEGFSNKEIAEKLYLGEGTVRNYVTLLLDKLELRDRTQLAIFYLKNLNK